MKTVYCPVIDGQIDGSACLEIVLVADKEAKPGILPPSIIWNDELCQKCKSCKYHADNVY